MRNKDEEESQPPQISRRVCNKLDPDHERCQGRTDFFSRQLWCEPQRIFGDAGEESIFNQSGIFNQSRIFDKDIGGILSQLLVEAEEELACIEQLISLKQQQKIRVDRLKQLLSQSDEIENE